MPTDSTPTKRCPRCRSVLTQDVTSCACGHRFDSTAAVTDPEEPSLAAQAEALYESLLRARLSRARRVVRFAKMEVLRNPGNATKLNELRAVEREAQLLEAQIVVQAARTEEARTASDQRSTDVPDTQNAAITSEASQAFRDAQAKKAEKTLEVLQRQAAEDALNAKRANSVFNAVQMEKARKIDDRITSPVCPACGETLTSGATRCNCGYLLTAETDSLIATDKHTTPRK